MYLILLVIIYSYKLCWKYFLECSTEFYLTLLNKITDRNLNLHFMMLIKLLNKITYSSVHLFYRYIFIRIIHIIIFFFFCHFSMAVDISPKNDGGVLKEILKEGEGDELPASGNKVSVHYTGTLLDGTKFDSSKDRNEPFTFTLGQSQVIKAWDIGVATMKKGEVAMLTCDAKYAYGKMGSPPKIPPDATLKFEVINIWLNLFFNHFCNIMAIYKFMFLFM